MWARPRPIPRAFTVALLGLTVLTSAASAKPGGRPGTVGEYDLEFRGAYTGTATAKVNADHVQFKVELKGKNGAAGTLDVPKLHIEDGRFNGQGTLGGQPVEISGRVDAGEGGVVSYSRLIVTIRTQDGRVARAFAENNEAKKKKNK